MLKKKLRNKFEKRIDRQLRKTKVTYAYESEKIPYIISAHYIPDFIIKLDNGDKIYIECKGYLRPEDKRKLVAVKRCHPTYDIRLLFFRLVDKSVKWAERHGFQWAVESVPDDWCKRSQEGSRSRHPEERIADAREMVH